MAVLILKTAGLIIVSLIALVTAVLILPFTVSIRYADKKTKVFVHLAVFKIRVFPVKQKEKKKTRTKKESSEESVQKKDSGRKFSLDKDTIISLLPALKKFLKQVGSTVKLRGVFLRAIVHKDDPMQTGLAAGRLWTVINGAKILLESLITVRYKSVRVIPDFMSEYEGKGEFVCKITVIPIILVAAFLKLLLAYMKTVKGKTAVVTTNIL